MPNLSISSYIQILMPVLNQEKNQKKAFRLLFNPIYRMIDDVDLSSKKISNIMNEKEDIHEAIRQAVNKVSLIEEIKDNFENKVVPILRKPLLSDLLNQYSQLIKNDNDISPVKKAELLNALQNKTLEESLAELFVYVVNIPFKKHDVFRKIHYCSNAVDANENDDVLSAVKQQYGAYADLDKGNSNKELIIGKLYKLTVKCSLESAIVRRIYMTNVEFEYAGIKYKAVTSCNNWLSQNKMNNILNAGTSTLTLIFDVLNKDNGTAHIYLIGELNK